MCKCKKKYALQHDKCKCTKIGRVTVNDLKLTLDLHTTYTTIDIYSHKAWYIPHWVALTTNY